MAGTKHDKQKTIEVFLISNSLTEQQCRDFRRKSLPKDNPYLLVKTSENPDIGRKDRQARYAVGRLPRDNETIVGNYRALVPVADVREL